LTTSQSGNLRGVSRCCGWRVRLVVWLNIAIICGCSLDAHAQHWSFKPPVRPTVPRVQRAGWVRNPIDAFVLRRLEQQRLSPSSPADKRTLLRRVTYDLTGLPPSPMEIAAFLADKGPNAYETVVRRLLASPHFGERWAQHWLDVVRFGESNGYEHDLDRPQAWRYRDWVVQALNSDKPYDQFLREQIAGDLLHPDDFDAHVATGFLRCGPFHITGGNLDPVEMRQEWLTEVVAGVGNGILGLTIACARCHDHKYDPIPQADYYRLQAYFAATANDEKSIGTDAEKRRYDDAVKALKEKAKPIETQIAVIERPYREQIREQKRQKLAPEYKAALAVEPAKRTPEQRKLAGEAGTQLNISWDEVVNVLSPEDRARRSALRQQLFAIDREMPTPLPATEGVSDGSGTTPAMHILVRGDVHNPGAEVTRGLPVCLSEHPNEAPKTGKARLDLAAQLTDSSNPLTARVFVNRLWQHLFGTGLVATPNDFGKHGQPPTHPELLDWLASEFMEETGDREEGRGKSGDGGENHLITSSPHQAPAPTERRPPADRPLTPSPSRPLTPPRPWSVKRMIALIVTSSAYRQACEDDRAKAAIDPENRLLWRMNRKRLDAEELRDSILAAVGSLNLEVGGPSVRIPLEPEVYDTIFTEFEPDNLWQTTTDARQHTRRSLYLFRKRNVRLPMLAVFDQPDMMTSCAARGQTVHALQALTLVNGRFMRAQSYALARRIASDLPDDRGRIDRLFTLTLGRPPSSAELKATQQFIVEQTAILRSRLSRKENIALPEDRPRNVDAAAFAALSDLCLSTLNLNEFIYVR